MIRNLIFILILFTLFQTVTAVGQEIVVLQTVSVPPYEEVIQGFTSVCKKKNYQIVVSELTRTHVISKVRSLHPRLVIAIGMGALEKVKQIKTVPVVYVMVLNPQSILSGEANITGVSMIVPPDKQLKILNQALRHVRTVGLVYDPEKTGALVGQARKAADQMGITLIAEDVHRPSEAPSRINQLKGRIDVFWMLPDTTVMTPETVEFLLLFSLENKTPIVTFSEKYVEMGALMSIGIDTYDIGRQAGEMANAILSGDSSGKVSNIDPRQAVISVNLKTAGKLGVTVDEAVVRDARIIK